MVVVDSQDSLNSKGSETFRDQGVSQGFKCEHMQNKLGDAKSEVCISYSNQRVPVYDVELCLGFAHLSNCKLEVDESLVVGVKAHDVGLY